MGRTASPPEREIEKLRAEIRRHERAYYVLDAPEVSDAEFDALMKRLQALEAEHPDLVTPDSPTQRVGGAATSDFKPVPHEVPMQSLDNAFGEEELRAWHERVVKGLGGDQPEYVVEAKIDGLSCALLYEHGVLTRAATRGDGSTGEDVTANAKTIKAVPLRLQGTYPEELEVRGEVYIQKKDFEAFNAKLEREGRKTFVNPRNSAAGALRQKDPKQTALRPLRFFAHSYGKIAGEPYAGGWDFLQACKKLGFAVPAVNSKHPGIDSVLRLYAELGRTRRDLPYEIDGLVVKVDAMAQRKRLGQTNKSPRWAVALKWAAEQVETKLLDIEFSVGRSGTITPVAKLEPVMCGGVTISNASLHNFEILEQLGVRPGDSVLIERAGEVIPRVVRLVKKKTGKRPSVKAPSACPSCGHKPVKEKDEYVAWTCENPACPAQIKGRLLHFGSRDALDIEGLGENVVEQLVDKGLVKEPVDLFKLTLLDLLTLDLFKEKKANNLLDALEAAKTKPLSKFLTALGIRHVGERMARIFAERLKTIDAFLAASEEDLAAVPDVGPTVAQTVHAYFASKDVKDNIKKFKKAGFTLSEPERARPAGAQFDGMTFVFTGELETLSRKEAEGKVLERGGKASGSVSKKTAYVVVGAAAGSKAKKAEKLGVKTLTELEFLKLIGEG